MCPNDVNHIGCENASLSGVKSTHDLGGYCTDHHMRVPMMLDESILDLGYCMCLQCLYIFRSSIGVCYGVIPHTIVCKGAGKDCRNHLWHHSAMGESRLNLYSQIESEGSAMVAETVSLCSINTHTHSQNTLIYSCELMH